MSQFPPHWITDMPGAKVKQVLYNPSVKSCITCGGTHDPAMGSGACLDY